MLFSFHISGKPVFVHTVNLSLVIEKCFFRISCKEPGKAASILVSSCKEPGKIRQATWQGCKHPGNFLQGTW